MRFSYDLNLSFTRNKSSLVMVFLNDVLLVDILLCFFVELGLGSFFSSAVSVNFFSDSGV